MSSIGEQLRAAREAAGLSLEDAARATHIRLKLLAAMEADDYTAFASPAQARGFVRNYAAFLGLEAEALLNSRRPGNGRGALPAGATPPPGVPPGRAERGRRGGPRGLLIGLLMVAALAVVAGVGAWQFLQTVLTPAPTLPAPAPTLPVTGSPVAGVLLTATPSPPPATATAALPTPLPNYVGVNVLVRAEQRLWLRALVDGVEAFAGQLAPGQTREFVGANTVELWTGNGRGARVVFNGQDQGVLGDLGEVVVRLWTVSGAVTPTPAPAPAP